MGFSCWSSDGCSSDLNANFRPASEVTAPRRSGYTRRSRFSRHRTGDIRVPLELHTIICSTRPGRVGPSVARWFHDFAVGHGTFEAVLVDLADFGLPVYDEPNHPVMQKYQHAHTRAWAARVAAADRKRTRLNSSPSCASRMPSSACNKKTNYPRPLH